MRLVRRSIFILVCAAVGLGCGVSSVGLPGLLASPTAAAPMPSDTQPAVATNAAATAPTDTVAPTEAAATDTAQPQAATSTAPAPAGAAVSYANISLVVPSGLATDTTNTTGTDVEFPFVNPSLGEMPQHAKIVLNGYPVQGTTLAPQVMAFPASEYAQYADSNQQLIAALQNMQYMDGQPLPDGFPDGPFSSHTGGLAMANGKGIRYLTQFNQAALPVNNQELIYYFHGLTSDGSTYVEAILPVSAAFLAPDDNPNSALPAGGIPFNMDDLAAYFQAVASKLDATPPSQFTPSLDTLDALIQSINTK